MLPTTNKNKKMVTNIKKRKSSISQNEPKAKSPKKDASAGDGPAPKNLRPKPVKAQLPKGKPPAKKLVKNAPAVLAVKPKPALAKRKGKQNGTDDVKTNQSKFEKRSPVKNIVKKNIKPKTPKPKIVKTEKPVDDAEESSEDESNEEQAKPIVQKGKKQNDEKQVTGKKKRPHKKVVHREKFIDLREKVKKGDKAALKEVEKICKGIEERGDLTRTSKRKLRTYRTILTLAMGKPAAVTAPKTPKAKKGAKKGQ